jgi:hypothetical protein
VTLLKSGLRFFNLVALSIFAKKRLALFLDHLFRLIPSAESKETVVILGSFAFCWALLSSFAFCQPLSRFWPKMDCANLFGNAVALLY